MEYILLTGASSGIGRALAVALSEDHALILSGRRKDALNETKQLCGETHDVLIWPCDLADTETIEYSFKEWKGTRELPVRGFVHCAGVMQMLPCRMITPERLMQTYSVNVFAPALLTRMLTSRKVNDKNLKSIVFISSNISNRGASAFSIYGSSKAALDGLMRNLAVELAPGVRVNSVLPGGMLTEMTKEMFKDEALKESFLRNYPLGIGTPRQIAPMVEFLLSSGSDWITGQQFTIDGGRTIDITER